MRECAYNACLINEKDSLRLQFITKRKFNVSSYILPHETHDSLFFSDEAASVHCINVLREYNISDGCK